MNSKFDTNEKEDINEHLEEKLEIFYNSLTEEQKLKYRKNIDDLTFTNHVIFPIILTKKQICIEFLSVLMRKKVTEIKLVEGEKTFKHLPGIRGVRLDVYVEDEKARYNIEMQIANNCHLPKRVRYNQCSIDATNLKEGIVFKDIKNTYIIFICMFDPFDKNLPIYTLHQTFKECTDYIYDDGTSKIFYNALEFDKIKDQDLKRNT